MISLMSRIDNSMGNSSTCLLSQQWPKLVAKWQTCLMSILVCNCPSFVWRHRLPTRPDFSLHVMTTLWLASNITWPGYGIRRVWECCAIDTWCGNDTSLALLLFEDVLCNWQFEFIIIQRTEPFHGSYGLVQSCWWCLAVWVVSKPGVHDNGRAGWPASSALRWRPICRRTSSCAPFGRCAFSSALAAFAGAAKIRIFRSPSERTLGLARVWWSLFQTVGDYAGHLCRCWDLHPMNLLLYPANPVKDTAFNDIDDAVKRWFLEGISRFSSTPYFFSIVLYVQ